MWRRREGGWWGGGRGAVWRSELEVVGWKVGRLEGVESGGVRVEGGKAERWRGEEGRGVEGLGSGGAEFRSKQEIKEKN